MFQLLMKMPAQLTLGCSGGKDSMVLLHFLSRRRKVRAANFNHGTTFGHSTISFVREYCQEKGIEFVTNEEIPDLPPTGKSHEAHWREIRYAWLLSLEGTIVTAHHLNDQMENYLFSTLNGRERLINPVVFDGRVIRPFLLVNREQIDEYAARHNVPWMEDPSNVQMKYKRALVRKELMPVALQVQPGLAKVVKKKTLSLMAEYKSTME